MEKFDKSVAILPDGCRLVDTHCHLDMADFNDDLEEVLSRAQQCGVAHIVTIGIDLASSHKAVELARHYPAVSATVGVHPHDVQATTEATYTALTQLIVANREYIVGYGEIGLDYVKKYSPPDLQQLHLRRQLAIAKELQLPVIIHDRDAHADTLRILQEFGPFPHGGVMHCFSGDSSFARKILDLGFSISLPGIVTFNNAVDMHNVAREIPLSSLLIETDGPFLAPHPWRGKRNEPAFILQTAACIAQLRGISIAEVAHATTMNASSLFGIDISQQLSQEVGQP